MQRKPEDPRPEPPVRQPLIQDPRKPGRPYCPQSWIDSVQPTSNRPSDDFWGCLE